MALSYCKIEVELREISLRDRPKSLYDISKKGTVPAILTKNNNVIDESLDIIIWALKKKDNQTWLNKNSEEINLINLNDTKFKKELDRYKYHDRYPQHTKESYRKKCDSILITFEKKLINKQYLLYDNISIADIAIFPFVRQFANHDREWFDSQTWSNLHSWLENNLESEEFKICMKK